MSFSAATEWAHPVVTAVRIEDWSVIFDLADGRTISAPLAWYPRLFDATPEQRAHFEISPSGYGVHWPDVDEDLSAIGLLRGMPSPEASRRG